MLFMWKWNSILTEFDTTHNPFDYIVVVKEWAALYKVTNDLIFAETMCLRQRLKHQSMKTQIETINTNMSRVYTKWKRVSEAAVKPEDVNTPHVRPLHHFTGKFPKF